MSFENHGVVHHCIKEDLHGPMTTCAPNKIWSHWTVSSFVWNKVTCKSCLRNRGKKRKTVRK